MICLCVSELYAIEEWRHVIIDCFENKMKENEHRHLNLKMTSCTVKSRRRKLKIKSCLNQTLVQTRFNVKFRRL